jgi:hypothetical protein
VVAFYMFSAHLADWVNCKPLPDLVLHQRSNSPGKDIGETVLLGPNDMEAELRNPL